MITNLHSISVLAAAFVFSVVGAFGFGESPSPDANRVTLEKAGFVCKVASVGAWECSKQGEKDRTCDSSGKCFISN